MVVAIPIQTSSDFTVVQASDSSGTLTVVDPTIDSGGANDVVLVIKWNYGGGGGPVVSSQLEFSASNDTGSGGLQWPPEAVFGDANIIGHVLTLNNQTLGAVVVRFRGHPRFIFTQFNVGFSGSGAASFTVHGRK